MGGEPEREWDKHICEFFPVVMRRKESCLLLSLTLRLYCVLCLWQSTPSSPVTACTSLRLCPTAHSARREDEMAWHSLIGNGEDLHCFSLYYKTERVTWGYSEEMERDGTNDERNEIGWDRMRWKEIRDENKSNGKWGNMFREEGIIW